jgi:pyruvate formate-lyase/glycerol dehydratase family glycyl radical enzyme
MMETSLPPSLVDEIRGLEMTDRIARLKRCMLDEPRVVSLEQARLITESYRQTEGEPRIMRRARSLAHVLRMIPIEIDPEELIVGNRTPRVRAGVVFPEAGIAWLNDEIEQLPTREQDTFEVRENDVREFRERLYPYWKERGLRDEIERKIGAEVREIAKVVKINQKDHAQGHICPHTRKWLKLGPAGIREEVERKESLEQDDRRKQLYEAVRTVLEASQDFMTRYGLLARSMADDPEHRAHENNLRVVSRICLKLASSPPSTFHEAVQSTWFLFVMLQMESNASSFSPGRMDQILAPYFYEEYEAGSLTLNYSLEIIEALWLKFNQIVYMRNGESARYFAGFPIGFNVALGGQTVDGRDASNLLSHLFLRAQAHIGLPQPNLSARVYSRSPDTLLDECGRVIGLGSGMPQIFNDESIIPALENQGIIHRDAMDYAIVGCVELTTHGNNLGWSDAAMFNMVKALELAINDGRCLITGEQIGPRTGALTDFATYEELEESFRRQLDHFIDRMINACIVVDRTHAELLPSPFLSAVIDDCVQRGIDVTAGGAHYNFSGVQAIQVANLADSLAALKKTVYEDHSVSAETLLRALRCNYEGYETLRQELLNRVPKYGNDVEWVDNIGLKWVDYFTERLKGRTNARGGSFHTGLYTVSAHVPMGKNVGATPDGRKAEQPLADGGLSAVYGRDRTAPTALLKSVSRIDSSLGSNGTLLNMKFLPNLFRTEREIKKFSDFLRTFVSLRIHHVQFNVLRKEDLIAAREHPEEHRALTVRVAGYTAYFTELSEDLQEEIIARTSYDEV